MRVIKFKFVVKDNEGKLHLSEPYELDMEEGMPHRDEILDNMERGCTSNCANESTNTCDCPSEFDEGEVVGNVQFTGLKDKNGKEVYENDIIKGKNFVGIVKFQNYMWIVHRLNADGEVEEEFVINEYKFEVIGNEHENPGVWV